MAVSGGGPFVRFWDATTGRESFRFDLAGATTRDVVALAICVKLTVQRLLVFCYLEYERRRKKRGSLEVDEKERKRAFQRFQDNTEKRRDAQLAELRAGAS